MSREQQSDAPLNRIELLGAHDQGEDAKHQLREPHAEPVDIVLAVGQVVHGLAELRSPAHSLADRRELLAAGKQEEDGHCGDVKVKSKDLVIEPCHDLGVVDDAIAAFFEHNSGLNDENAEDVDEDLANHEEAADDLPILGNKHVAHVVEDDGHEVRAAGIAHQPFLVGVDEGERLFVCALLRIWHLEELLAVEAVEDDARGQQRQVHHRVH